MSLISPEDLQTLNDKIYEQGYIDREDLLQFLTLIHSTDDKQIVDEVKAWLENLHNDTKYSKIVFPQGHINMILGDLDSYGRVQPETIMKFRTNSANVLPQS